VTRRFSPEAAVAGLGLVWLGLVWTLANLGMMDGLYVMRKWWPWLLVAWGAMELLRVRDAAREGRE
jgi:hypothetical protein